MSDMEHLSDQQIARVEALRAASSIGTKVASPFGGRTPPDVPELVDLAEYILKGTHPMEHYWREEQTDDTTGKSGAAAKAAAGRRGGAVHVGVQRVPPPGPEHGTQPHGDQHPAGEATAAEHADRAQVGDSSPASGRGGVRAGGEVGPVVSPVKQNLYRIQRVDGEGYAPTSRGLANLLVEKGRAEWIGTDYDEDLDAFVHYADRIDNG